MSVETIKLHGTNIHNTGNNTAAEIDPNETILVTIIITKANTKQISPNLQLIVRRTPSDVATPLPPLNLKNTGKVCPITTRIPAIWQSIAWIFESAFIIFPIKKAINIATTPFKTSQSNVRAAAFLPATLKTFVDPAFPLPLVLTSTCANFCVNIIENERLP